MDLDFSNSRIEELERSLATRQDEIKKLRLQLQQSQQEIGNLKQDLSNQQSIFESTLSSRLEEEKSKWFQQGLPSPLPYQPRTDSPSTSLRKHSDFGLLNIGLTSRLGHASDPVGSMSDRPPTRRSSFQPPPFSSDRGTPPRQPSIQSLSQLPMNGINNNIPPPETPSIHTLDPSDDFFAETPATPGTHRGSAAGVNDILSHATIPAGPSVQLVERLSQTVRRLESERAASKDELSRLTAQRDEARQEVVELMREVETKRKGDERITSLENEVRELDSRYQASLEMLGEKSEMVEELKADVSDLKRILRETMDSMMK
jgi:TATA element modulatory factor